MAHTAGRVAGRLTCADCGAKAMEETERCPTCGGRRLQAPPDLFTSPWVIGGVAAAIGGALIVLSLIAMAVPISLLANTGFTLPGEQDRRVRSLERQWDLIRDAERALPLYPGSMRVREEHGTLANGQARSLAVCWTAAADFETVRRFYLGHLSARDSGWQPLGGGSRVFRKGRIYLAVTPPEASRPACAGAYQLNFSYQI